MERLVDPNDDSYEKLIRWQGEAKFEQQKQAQMEHRDYADSIIRSDLDFVASLAASKETVFYFPKWLRPYHPSRWCKLPFPPEGWMTAETKKNIDDRKSSLMEALRDHVDVNLDYTAWYIPSVKYEVIVPPSSRSKGRPTKTGTGVPSLRWLLAIYIRTTVDFWMTDGIIVDERYGYVFEDLQCTDANLGRMYSIPELWQYQPAFITPIILLEMLARGISELSGVEVLRRDPPWTTYGIEGLADEITLHDDFRRFIRDMAKKTPLDKALLSRYMCDEETAGLVKTKLERLKEPEAPEAVPKKSVGPGNEAGDDYPMVVSALEGMSFTKGEAVKAAKYVCGKYPQETLEEKIKIALQYPSQ